MGDTISELASNSPILAGMNEVASTIPEQIESMRQDAIKNNNADNQLHFAKYLLQVDQKIQINPGILGISNINDERVGIIRGRIQNEAIRWYKKLVTGSPNSGGRATIEGMFTLAEFYGRGMYGLCVNHAKAFAFYQAASKHNHPAATYRTAVCFEVGAGTKKDNTRAFQFYKKAASLSDSLAQHKLALILLYGKLGQKKNLKEGISWLKRAATSANADHPESLYDLAQCYEKNGGCPVVIPDEGYAFELYSQAAHFGYSKAQFRLGAVYEFGLLGCNKEASLSIRWYSKAAEQGLADAELALSGWYSTGAQGALRQSDTDAYLWSRKAAERGHPKAEYLVGSYFEEGIGVDRNLEEAKYWYAQSAKKGYSRASQKLKELNANNNTKCSII